MCPVIDALSGGVIGALYRRRGGQLKRVWREQHKPVQEFFDALRKTVPPGDAVEVVGGGALLCRKALGSRAPKNWRFQAAFPRADVLLGMTLRQLPRMGKTSYQRVLPLYVRRPVVLERLQARRRRG